jgi:hypothetical protein
MLEISAGAFIVFKFLRLGKFRESRWIKKLAEAVSETPIVVSWKILATVANA